MFLDKGEKNMKWQKEDAAQKRGEEEKIKKKKKRRFVHKWHKYLNAPQTLAPPAIY